MPPKTNLFSLPLVKSTNKLIGTRSHQYPLRGQLAMGHTLGPDQPSGLPHGEGVLRLKGRNTR